MKSRHFLRTLELDSHLCEVTCGLIVCQVGMVLYSALPLIAWPEGTAPLSTVLSVVGLLVSIACYRANLAFGLAFGLSFATIDVLFFAAAIGWPRSIVPVASSLRLKHIVLVATAVALGALSLRELLRAALYVRPIRLQVPLVALFGLTALTAAPLALLHAGNRPAAAAAILLGYALITGVIVRSFVARRTTQGGLPQQP